MAKANSQCQPPLDRALRVGLILLATLGLLAVSFLATPASASHLEWDKPVTLDTAGTHPYVATSNTGRQIIAWEGHAHPNKTIIRVATRNAKGEWSKPVDLSPAAPEQVASSASIDRSGRGIVIWAGMGKKNIRSLWIAREQPNGSWSHPKQLTGSGENVCWGLSAEDPSGNTFASWVSHPIKEKTFSAKAAFLSNDGTPIAIKQLPSNPGDIVLSTRPALMENGRGAVVIQSKRVVENKPVIVLSVTVQMADGEWGRSHELFVGPSESDELQSVSVKSNKVGELLVAWMTGVPEPEEQDTQTDSSHQTPKVNHTTQPRRFHSVIRSATGEWKPIVNSSELDGPSDGFALFAHGPDQFVVNFWTDGKNLKHIPTAYLRSCSWSKTTLPLNPLNSEPNSDTSWFGFSDSEGRYRLFWLLPGRMDTANVVDNHLQKVEKSPVEWVSPCSVIVDSNSPGELVVGYQFVSAEERPGLDELYRRFGVKVVSARVVEDDKAAPKGKSRAAQSEAKFPAFTTVGNDSVADFETKSLRRFTYEPVSMTVDNRSGVAPGGYLVIDAAGFVRRETFADQPGEIIAGCDGPECMKDGEDVDPRKVRLVSPRTISVDEKGGVFITEPTKFRVRYIDPTGKTIRTVAGKNVRIMPLTVRAAKDGSYVIFDGLTHSVRRIESVDKETAITTIAGGGKEPVTDDWQPASQVSLGVIESLRPAHNKAASTLLVDSERHLVYEQRKNRIRKISVIMSENAVVNINTVPQALAHTLVNKPTSILHFKNGRMVVADSKGILVVDGMELRRLRFELPNSATDLQPKILHYREHQLVILDAKNRLLVKLPGSELQTPPKEVKPRN